MCRKGVRKWPRAPRSSRGEARGGEVSNTNHYTGTVIPDLIRDPGAFRKGVRKWLWTPRSSRGEAKWGDETVKHRRAIPLLSSRT